MQWKVILIFSSAPEKNEVIDCLARLGPYSSQYLFVLIGYTRRQAPHKNAFTFEYWILVYEQTRPDVFGS